MCRSEQPRRESFRPVNWHLRPPYSQHVRNAVGYGAACKKRATKCNKIAGHYPGIAARNYNCPLIVRRSRSAVYRATASSKREKFKLPAGRGNIKTANCRRILLFGSEALGRVNVTSCRMSENESLHWKNLRREWRVFGTGNERVRV